MRLAFDLGLESKVGEKTRNLLIYPGYSTVDEMVECHIASSQCNIALM